jgi:hypothetical protein
MRTPRKPARRRRPRRSKLREYRPLALALLPSLLVHALILSLQLGGQEPGLPGFDFPWHDRRAEAPLLPPLRVRLEATGPVAKSDDDADFALPGSAGEDAPAPRVVAALPLLAEGPARSGTPPPLAAEAPAAVLPAAPPAPDLLAMPAPEPSRFVVPAAAPPPTPALAAAASASSPEPAAESRVEVERQAVAQQAAAARAAALLEEARTEAARAEAARLEAERRQAAQMAAERLDAEKREAARRAGALAAQQELARQEAVRQDSARIEAERLEAERREAARVAAARQALALQEAARLEAARIESERQQAARQAAAQQEQARQELARQEAARVEAARLAAASQEAARLQAARDEEERRLAARRAMGRQLDLERAQREAAANANRTGSGLPSSWSSARRGRLLGRSDPNAELVLYAEAWARKIQLNTAVDVVREAAAKPHVDPMVTVAIRSDGSVESVTFVLSSGVPEIDDAIRRIVQSHVPYTAFTPALAHEFDVIEIRRTWYFDAAVRLF